LAAIEAKKEGDDGMTLLSVQVKKSEVRAKPSFLGTIVARVSYGDRVELLVEQGAWLKVGLPGRKTEGWMHASALTRKKIELQAGGQAVGQTASSDEVALAGKGFNQQVEDTFKAQNPKLDFAWVDKMEKIVVSQSEMEAFLRDGKVTPEGGL
jgi:hypothetical protein